MLTNLIIQIVNLNILANSEVQQQMRRLAHKSFKLNLNGLALTCLIKTDGQWQLSQLDAECSIKITLASATYLIDHDKIKAFKSIQITGNHSFARHLLNALSHIEPSKVLYQHSNSQLGTLGLTLALQIVHTFINYLRLITYNCSNSLAQYLQYEQMAIVDSNQLEQFYQQVDEIKARSALLAKRIQRLETQHALI